MEFEWDEDKSARNTTMRGLSFGDAALIFDGPTLEAVDDRRGYGEVRVKAIGRIGDECFVVIYTDRPGVRRIISARRASRKERNQWRSFARP